MSEIAPQTAQALSPDAQAPVSAVQTAPTDGLFPKLSRPASPAPTESAPANDWFIMDGMPGSGQRPEFLSPKYKTLADQAKAYTELEKKLGVQKAPDKYDLSKYDSVLSESDSNTQRLLHFAREKQLGQDVVEGVLDVFSEYVQGQKVDYSKEIEKLGANGREKIKTVAQWAENTLSDSAIETINKFGHNAEFINFLDEMRQFQFHNAVSIPSGTEPTQSFTPLTVAEVEDEMKQNFKRYNEDAKYRAEIKAKFAQAVGEG